MALLVGGMLALAVNLRASITGLPPVFPELAAALHLSSGAIAALAAVPVLCFGLFSGLAAPLSRRLGEERILLAALLLLSAGLLLRGSDPSVLLFPGTVLAGGAIALMNVLLPSLVKRRRPDRAGLLIGAYLLTMSSGAVVGALIAVPVYQAAAGSTKAVAGLAGPGHPRPVGSAGPGGGGGVAAADPVPHGAGSHGTGEHWAGPGRAGGRGSGRCQAGAGARWRISRILPRRIFPRPGRPAVTGPAAGPR